LVARQGNDDQFAAWANEAKGEEMSVSHATNETVSHVLDQMQNMIHGAEQHVLIAHAKIERQAKELRLLNGVIARRKRVTRRLRAYVDAVKQLHEPYKPYELEEGQYCVECSRSNRMVEWPCRTIDAIETARQDFVKGLKPSG